jgi:hypothetical protein
LAAISGQKKIVQFLVQIFFLSTLLERNGQF